MSNGSVISFFQKKSLRKKFWSICHTLLVYTILLQIKIRRPQKLCCWLTAFPLLVRLLKSNGFWKSLCYHYRYITANREKDINLSESCTTSFLWKCIKTNKNFVATTFPGVKQGLGSIIGIRVEFAVQNVKEMFIFVTREVFNQTNSPIACYVSWGGRYWQYQNFRDKLKFGDEKNQWNSACWSSTLMHTMKPYRTGPVGDMSTKCVI